MRPVPIALDLAAVEGAPDETLMRRVSAGDRDAFRLLVTRHIDPVVGLARRVVGDADCEDIAQEVFLKLWSRKGLWQPRRGALRTWLCRVALIQCLDRVRPTTPRLMAEPTDRLGEARESPELREAQGSSRPLTRLPVRHRLAITLYYHHDLTVAEVAAVMDLEIHAVESLLKRGRRKRQWGAPALPPHGHHGIARHRRQRRIRGRRTRRNGARSRPDSARP